MSLRVSNFRFSSPFGQAFYMLVILAAFAFGIGLIYPRVHAVFAASPYLNSIIVLVFLIGILICFWQIFQLSSSVRWINAYSGHRTSRLPSTPRLLAPLAVMMKGDRLPTGISTSSAQNILDSISIRLDESRDIAGYIVNLLIYLGLLGTFFGLATTIPAIIDTIRALNTGGEFDSNTVVIGLMNGLEAQLGGMGTAFGTSLIGLAGSLMVGLLELFATHGQNRFYREFEEWLSHFTKVGMAESGGDFVANPEGNPALTEAFIQFNHNISVLQEQLSTQGKVFSQISESLAHLAHSSDNVQNMSSDSRAALQTTESLILRMKEDMEIARETNSQNMHRDLAMINKSLREIIAMQKD